MTPFVHFAMLGWPLVAAMLFLVVRPARAAAAGVAGAWMLLPNAVYDIPVLPDYDRTMAALAGTLAGALLFAPQPILRLRPRWCDALVLGLCLWPAAGSLAGGFGAWDAGSAVMEQFVRWGIPWLLGRAYFGSLRGQEDLAWILFLGGLALIPVCLYEIRMSPMLHAQVYGFRSSIFAQHVRDGAYRPQGFMQHGLMLGLWMCSAVLCGGWLAYRKRRTQLLGLPLPLVVGGLFAVAVLCRSFGALVLLAGAAGALLVASRLRLRLPLAAMACVPLLYAGARTAGLWDGHHVSAVAQALGEPDRAQSWDFRMHHEAMLVDHALGKPLTGWGRWDAFRVKDDQGRDVSVTDGLWVIVLGQTGVPGLVLLLLVLVAPALVALRALGAIDWRAGPAAGALAMVAVTLIFAIDCMPNAMLNPYYLLAAGGLAGFRRTALAREMAALRTGRTPAASAAPTTPAPAAAGAPWKEALR